MESLLISIVEAAKLAGIGKDRAYVKVKSGEWPSVLIGKRNRMVPRAQLIALYSAKQEDDANG